MLREDNSIGSRQALTTVWSAESAYHSTGRERKQEELKIIRLVDQVASHASLEGTRPVHIHTSSDPILGGPEPREVSPWSAWAM